MNIRIVNIARAMALIGIKSNIIELKYLPKEKSNLHSSMALGIKFLAPRESQLSYKVCSPIWRVAIWGICLLI